MTGRLCGSISSQFVSSSPASGSVLTSQSGACFRFCVSLSLSVSPSLALCLCLWKLNKHLKKLKKFTWLSYFTLIYMKEIRGKIMVLKIAYIFMLVCIYIYYIYIYLIHMYLIWFSIYTYILQIHSYEEKIRKNIVSTYMLDSCQHFGIFYTFDAVNFL